MVIELETSPKTILQRSKVDKVVSLLKRKISPKKLPFVVYVAFPSLSEMKKLNFYYRKKNKPTDVLSIRSEVAGEVYLCPAYIKKQATENKVPFKEETHRLFIHGLLHLAGFEHETNSRDAKKMFSLQEKSVEALGFTPREWQQWVLPSPLKKRDTK